MDNPVEKLSILLEQKKLMLCTAESCTGGMIAAAMTERPGSSTVFERGFVTYSNISKAELLGVDNNILKTHGAVSKECARAMAEGALKHSHADIAASVTGIAGPGGAQPGKPVGLVYIHIVATNSYSESYELHLLGSRHKIRTETTEFVLSTLIDFIETGIK